MIQQGIVLDILLPKSPRFLGRDRVDTSCQSRNVVRQSIFFNDRRNDRIGNPARGAHRENLADDLGKIVQQRQSLDIESGIARVIGIMCALIKEIFPFNIPIHRFKFFLKQLLQFEGVGETLLDVLSPY